MERHRVPVASTIASVLYLATLASPYAGKPVGYVNTYYGWGVPNPLIGGSLVALLPVVLVAVRKRHLSPPTAAGLAVGLAASATLITGAWAFTARLDVFRATGWALPLQRFILTGAGLLILAGIAWDWRQGTSLGAANENAAPG